MALSLRVCVCLRLLAFVYDNTHIYSTEGAQSAGRRVEGRDTENHRDSHTGLLPLLRDWEGNEMVMRGY